MQRNWIWAIFIVLIALFAFWFVIRAGQALLSYYQFSTKVAVVMEKWSVEEIKSDQFAVKATYSYEYSGKNYQGSDRAGALYPNPWAAENAQKQLARKTWGAWINPSHPERSVLEKRFPYKRVISSVVLLGILLYFSALGIFLRARHGK